MTDGYCLEEEKVGMLGIALPDPYNSAIKVLSSKMVSSNLIGFQADGKHSSYTQKKRNNHIKQIFRATYTNLPRSIANPRDI